MRSTRWSMAALVAWIACVALSTTRADAPAGRYQTTVDTVHDTKTMLTWQRVIDPTDRSLSGAASHCGSLATAGGGWRMPSLRELQTLVDTSRSNPAIDPTAFPGTPSSFTWSVTPNVEDLTEAWGIFFSDGNNGLNPTGELHLARCVR